MKTSSGLQAIWQRAGSSLSDVLASLTMLSLVAGLLLPTAIVRARKNGHVALCQNNLKQQGIAHSILFQETGIQYEAWPRLWIQQLHRVEPNLQSRQFCPSAPERRNDRLSTSGPGGLVNRSWLVAGGQITNQGSYGMNGFFYSNEPNTSQALRFATSAPLAVPARTPVFADSVWVDFWPSPSDQPARDLVSADNFSGTGISRIAIPRHGPGATANKRDFNPANTLPGAVNLVFADNHVEMVPLEKLWTFLWHREWVAPAKRPGR